MRSTMRWPTSRQPRARSTAIPVSEDHRGMPRGTGLGRVVLTRALVLAALLGACATSTFAQAWAHPAGTGAVTVSFQNLDYSGHFGTDGEFAEDVGNSVHNRVDFEADFAITDRLLITVGIPFVFTRYTSPDPLPPFVPFLPVDDCRCWHSGWQDFGFTARYNLVNGAFGDRKSTRLNSS